MVVEKDKDIYTVKLNKEELFNAFGSYDDFQMFLHEICRRCYGEALANELFPVGGVKPQWLKKT